MDTNSLYRIVLAGLKRHRPVSPILAASNGARIPGATLGGYQMKQSAGAKRGLHCRSIIIGLYRADRVIRRFVKSTFVRKIETHAGS